MCYLDPFLTEPVISRSPNLCVIRSKLDIVYSVVESIKVLIYRYLPVRCDKIELFPNTVVNNNPAVYWEVLLPVAYLSELWISPYAVISMNVLG